VRRGLTLLEVLVEMLILSLVVAGYLELFHGSHVLLARSRQWTTAIAIATDGIEQAKLGDDVSETLPSGFRQQTTETPWQPGLTLITVTVTLPNGARFNLRRLRADQ
jgi:hypothetical protein